MCKYLFYFLLFLLFNRTEAEAQSNRPSFTYSNLPIVIIDTEGQVILDDPKIMAKMGIIWNSNGDTNFVTDAFNEYDGYIGIEIRGFSSQAFPKKQYGIELWDNTGDDIDASLLGMPSESDWVLSAPYNDKTLMRDMLAYSLGEEMGHYTPRAKYCELVLNGVYEGVYMLREKIKRNKNRVDIKKMEPDKISGTAVTGGYIIQIDRTVQADSLCWTSTYLPSNNLASQQVNFIYEYPKAEDIAIEQKEYIQNYFYDFESSLAGSEFNDVHNGYRKYIDVGTFIDYFLITELTKNVDGYRLSTFLNKQNDANGGKLRMGPIWDFNLGFGNVDYCTGGSHEGWAYEFNEACPYDTNLVPFWWNRFLEDSLYLNDLKIRWSALRANQFSEPAIFQIIDSAYVLLNEGGQQRNFIRWPVMGSYVWPNYYVGTSFLDETDWLKSWISDRLNWMDDAIQQFTVKDKVNSTIAITDFQIYPNPSTGDVVFTNVESIEWVRVMDMYGKTELYFSANFTTQLKGLVLVEVKTRYGILSQKLMVR